MTCPDTFAVPCQSLATTETGMMAARTEENENIKYSKFDIASSLLRSQIERSVVVGVQSMALLPEIGRPFNRVTRLQLLYCDS